MYFLHGAYKAFRAEMHRSKNFKEETMDNFTPGNKYCPNCGAPNSATARFCVRCGAAFGVPDATAPAPAQPQYNPAQPQYNPAPVPAQPQYAPMPAGNGTEMLDSRFTGGAFANFFIGLLTLIVSVITLTLAYPAMKCWKMRWEAKHTYINGRHLVFDGKGIQLFGKYIIWFLLSIITLGIYYLVRGRVNIIKWQTKHTHIEGVEGGESKFTGGALALFGHSLLAGFVTIITLTFGAYWAKCHMERWYAKHTVYDGYKLEFDGKAIQYFGKCICWVLLTIITIGIYSFWLLVKMKRWIIKHTVFCAGQELPPVTDPKQMNKAANAQANMQANAQTYATPNAATYVQPKYAPVQAAQPVQSNGKATAGFVLSLLSFLGLGITFVMPLLGIIFSGLGISHAKTANSGKGLAVAGLVLGILSFVWAAAYYIFILPMMFM